MKKIYLFCAAGMSTSILANRMQEVAKKNNILVETKAFSYSKIKEIVEEKNPDVILLGPQIRHLYKGVAEAYEERCPIAIIDSEDYGMMRGDKVLKSALDMLKKFNHIKNSKHNTSMRYLD